MRYCAPEKLEIIRLVEQSHLPVRRTLEQLGIPRPTFYRWYEHYRSGGPETLHDRPSKPDRVWNRITNINRIAHAAFAFNGIGYLEDAKAKAWHFDTIVQRRGRNIRHDHFLAGSGFAVDETIPPWFSSSRRNLVVP